MFFSISGVAGSGKSTASNIIISSMSIKNLIHVNFNNIGIILTAEDVIEMHENNDQSNLFIDEYRWWARNR